MKINGGKTDMTYKNKWWGVRENRRKHMAYESTDIEKKIYTENQQVKQGIVLCVSKQPNFMGCKYVQKINTFIKSARS